jgi:putative transposase
LLDEGRTGNQFLAQLEIADLIVAKLFELQSADLCEVDSFVVMPNHVHVLWTPTGSLSDLMQRLKGSTAAAANRLLGRSGEKFWQDEAFDRQIRNEPEARRIRAYIHNNPVRAGLVNAPELYRWSSAWGGDGLHPAQGFSPQSKSRGAKACPP